MTDTPIRDSLKRLDTLPKDEFRAGVVAQDGDAGAIVEADNDFGKPGGWSGSAEAGWFKKAGWRVAALVKWRKDKP